MPAWSRRPGVRCGAPVGGDQDRLQQLVSDVGLVEVRRTGGPRDLGGGPVVAEHDGREAGGQFAELLEVPLGRGGFDVEDDHVGVRADHRGAGRRRRAGGVGLHHHGAATGRQHVAQAGPHPLVGGDDGDAELAGGGVQGRHAAPASAIAADRRPVRGDLDGRDHEPDGHHGQRHQDERGGPRVGAGDLVAYRELADRSGAAVRGPLGEEHPAADRGDPDRGERRAGADHEVTVATVHPGQEGGQRAERQTGRDADQLEAEVVAGRRQVAQEPAAGGRDEGERDEEGGPGDPVGAEVAGEHPPEEGQVEGPLGGGHGGRAFQSWTERWRRMVASGRPVRQERAWRRCSASVTRRTISA